MRFQRPVEVKTFKSWRILAASECSTLISWRLHDHWAEGKAETC